MIDFYWVPTANGQRAAIVLEETGERYRLHPVDLMRGEHLAPEYLAVNPVGKTPTIVDAETGATVYGTLAIGLYLCDKHGMLLGDSLAMRAAVYHWAGLVASDLGPAFTGQYIFNVMAPEHLEFPVRYFDEQVIRLLSALERRLTETPYLGGEVYSLADALAYPAAATSAARLPKGLEQFPALRGWQQTVAARPAVQRAMALQAEGVRVPA
ncbi:MAG: glutathione S-transferase N-terminal domain-containing protein [Gammaproteobacteria bacterium]|nr:glutathione S-transferase N-terminal domain-containing protein [Gammaproteobacteria bacterium]TVQ48774.1 MAG: glutathione S-transferase [Gammaproteobacteria bacterium]